MQLIVELKTPAAGARKGRRGHTTVLGEIRKAFDLQLEPLHPGATDAGMQRFYAVEIADRQAAEHALERLRAHPSVEAAYGKPTDEPP